MVYDVFLCHGSQDKGWVRQLATRIDAETYNGRNLRSWFDERHIEAGDRLRPELEAALDDSLFVAVVLSAASVRSKWTSFEWNHFSKLHPKGGGIVPLILEKSTKDDLPIEFRDLVFIDFSDPTDGLQTVDPDNREAQLPCSSHREVKMPRIAIGGADGL